MKKIFILMFCMIFLISTLNVVEAAEWDNYGKYNSETKTMTIKNGLTFGTPIAEVELKTPLVYKVARGYQKVAEFEVRANGKYENAFKELELFDKRDNMKKFNRDYDYKIKTTKIISVPDYENYEIVGYHDEVVEDWVLMEDYDLVKGEIITIGIFTEVKKGDRVEWIPNLFGIRINEWAVWTEGLNVGLVSYWNFNTNANDSLGLNNGTLIDNAFINTTAGILGGGLQLDGSGDFSDLGNHSSLNPIRPFSISIWINATTFPSQVEIMGKGQTGGVNGYDIRLTGTAANMELVKYGVSGQVQTFPSPLSSKIWYHLVAVQGTTQINYYLDGVNFGNFSNSGAINPTNVNSTIGSTVLLDSADFNGIMDEVGFWNRSLTASEISDLYNNGTGITFTDIFELVTTDLISPVDGFNISSASINFSVNSTPAKVNLTNVTLYIWHSNNTLLLTNFTSLSGNETIVTNWTISNIQDGDYIWNALTKGTLDTEDWASNRTFTVDTTAPVINILSPTGIINFHQVGGNLTINWTVSDLNLQMCWFEYNFTNTTVTCGDNNFSFITTTQKNLTFYANDTGGNLGSNFTSWDYKVLEINQTFNSSTYDTSIESFSININSNGAQLVTANFIYDGTDYGLATKTGDNLEMKFSNSISIPIVTSTINKSFYWNVHYGAEDINTTSKNQTVNPIILSICNSTNNVAYINFTFKNETLAQEDISATISSSWTYYLGTGIVNKTLNILNATENPSYAFCFTPADKSLITIIDLDYNNAESQQRSFSSTSILTNITTNKILYLLPTSLGLFSPFQAVDFIGNSIIGARATITREIDSSTITVASALTDSSGFINFFLNPDITYSATFVKTGFLDNIFSFIPTTDIRTVRMAAVGGELNGSTISINTTYQTFPINSSLNNNTDYTFGFDVSSSETITLISMNITNLSNSQLLFVSNAGVGFISSTLNTGNNTQLIGKFLIQTGDETITFTRLWEVGEIFVGEYSIFKQFSFFPEYGFKDFIRYLLIIATILGILIFMSAGEVIDTSESKVIVIVLLIWAFSIVGWLNNPAVVAETGIAQYSKQYGIAILSTAASLLFIFRRVFA